MIIFRIFLISFCLMQILLAQNVLAKNVPAKNQAVKKSPAIITTTIRASFIDIKRKNETVRLTGNVTVERQDGVMKADEMVVYYYENKNGADKKNQKNKKDDQNAIEKGAKIKKIEAKNNVKIFNGEFIATGTNGFYNPEQHNFILEKDVIFNNGTSVAKGQKFVYDLNTKKGNLVGAAKTLTNKKPNSNYSEDGITKEDGRVIVIIDDNNFKKPNKSK